MKRKVLIRFAQEATSKERRALILVSDAVENAINGPGSKKAFSYQHLDKKTRLHGMTREEAGLLAKMLTECDTEFITSSLHRGAIEMVFDGREGLEQVLRTLFAKIESITFDPLPEAPALPGGGTVGQEVEDQFLQSMLTHGAVFYTEILYERS